MAKERIYELAKELKMPSKDLVDLAKKEGITVKSHMSSVTSEEANRLRSMAKGGNANKPAAVKQNKPKQEKTAQPKRQENNNRPQNQNGQKSSNNNRNNNRGGNDDSGRGVHVFNKNKNKINKHLHRHLAKQQCCDTEYRNKNDPCTSWFSCG